MPSDASKPWWEEPYRIVQTNLRLIDATLDPQQLARQVRAFGASALTFNAGGIFAFYPTNLALQARNPYLQGDLTGAMLHAARAEGLRMLGRYDLSKGTRIAYEAHPEWFVHNAAGEPQEYNGTYQACVNGGWALNYAHRILEESLGRYDLDGVFFNMTGYQPVDYSGRYRGICHCRNCRTGFADMFGRTLPEREDFGDPAFADYLEFKKRTSRAASERLYDTVKRVRPDTGVMGNGHGSYDFMRLELQRAVNRPAPEWPHQAGELTRWAASVGRGRAYSCASTNFLDYQWRYASETAHNHMLRFGQQIAGGAQIDYYLLGLFDQPNSAMLEPVRGFMEWHAQNGEHLVGTLSKAKVALYHSRSADLYAGATTTGKARTNSFRGAYRLLLEARIPFDFVSDQVVGDPGIGEMLARYDVILLPNTTCLGDDEAAVLDAYVAQGGTLIATGETGLYNAYGARRKGFALECLPVTKVNHVASGLETYMQIAEDELGFQETHLLHVDGWYFHADRREDAQGMLTLLPQPRYGPPELCFDEIVPGSNPGIISRPFGKGQVHYLPWLPEWLYFRDGLPEHRELFVQLIARTSTPPVKLEGAGAVEVTVRGKSGGFAERVVHLVNYAGQRQSVYEEPPSLHGLRLGVHTSTVAAPTRAKLLVAGSEVAFGALDACGYAWAQLPPLRYFECMVLPGLDG